MIPYDTFSWYSDILGFKPQPLRQKEKVQNLRTFILFCVLLVISAISTSLRSHLAEAVPEIYGPATFNAPHPSVRLRVPPPISDIYPIVRPANPTSPLPFTTPQILAVYSYRHNISTSFHDLIIYASGVNIGSFSRQIAVTGCLVDEVAYPAIITTYDIIKCTIPHPPPPNAKVSLTLRNDEILQELLSFKPVSLRAFNATLPRGVIVDPSEGLLSLTDGYPQAISPTSTKMLASKISWSTFPTERILGDEIPSTPRYRICLMTMVRPFAETLKDWVRYYRKIGVDKVFILDNISDHPIEEDFRGREDVEVIYWPFERSQVQGLTYLLHATRARCEWVFAGDVDEYLMPGLKGSGHLRPLQWYLQSQRRETHMAKFSYIELVGNRSTTATEPMPIAYTHQPPQTRISQGKSACRTDYNWRLHMIHDCEPANYSRFIAEKDPVPEPPLYVSDMPKTVHYKLRSWEEYLTKDRLGSSSVIDWINNPTQKPIRQLPRWFAELTKNAESWTYFRDIYRKIMDTYDEHEQALVWMDRSRRCEVKRNVLTGWTGSPTCTSVF